MLPPTNAVPPFNVTRASHVVLTLGDLAKARDFYTEVIGLKVSHETATTIHFRGVEERAHHSLTIRRTKGPPECERIGFRMFDEDDLERAKSHFEARGLPSRFVNVPFQGRTLHGTDAAGTPLEFCARMKTLPRSHADTTAHRGAGALRISHFQLSLLNVVAASAFYCDAGFRISEYSCVGDHVVGALLHRKDDPHDLVLQEGAGPQLHHVGYVVPETYHVMRAIDAARQLRLTRALEHGPGRYGHSYRVYLRDPDGHRIALLLPPIQVIDADEESVRHEVDRKASAWGPAPPPEWFGEATGFAGVTVRDSPRRAAGSFGEGLGFREGDTPYQADTQPVRQSTNPLETAA